MVLTIQDNTVLRIPPPVFLFLLFVLLINKQISNQAEARSYSIQSHPPLGLAFKQHASLCHGTKSHLRAQQILTPIQKLHGIKLAFKSAPKSC
ncbi:hypothetical protein GGI35DRAFT_321937 [Trichoderma velutinum]